MPEPVGLILAGGKGARFGGVDKSALMLAGESLLTRAVARLQPQVRSLAINANQDVQTDLPVIADTLVGHLGPLAGILTGLEWAGVQGASHMVSVAVDTPFFPCDLVPQLMLAAENHPNKLAIAATEDGSHGAFGLWPVALKDPLETFLQAGGRKVRDFTDVHHAALAIFPETNPPAFFNVNTPRDLEAAAQWM